MHSIKNSSHESLLGALLFVSKVNLTKLEIAPYLSMNLTHPLTKKVLNYMETLDNGVIQVMCSHPDFIDDSAYSNLLIELVRFYLPQQSQQITPIIETLLKVNNLERLKQLNHVIIQIKQDKVLVENGTWKKFVSIIEKAKIS